jgi:2-(1,2-epoxy-1,2-dihydrophenyl)acetyl-CoA isomerase
VNAVFPEAEFDREVRARAIRLASGPSIALRYMKENLNRAVRGDLIECMDMEVVHHHRTRDTEDHQEAAQAFVEKREPKFQGR